MKDLRSDGEFFGALLFWTEDLLIDVYFVNTILTETIKAEYMRASIIDCGLFRLFNGIGANIANS